MKKYLVNKNSDRLLIFFTGWGCDETEFEHIEATSDVLILYDYYDLSLDFDFSKYKNFDLISYSAGIFIAAIFSFDFEIKRNIAISGSPYLFDEHFGLSAEIQKILCNVTIENADEFAKNYLIKTDDEWKNFHHSKRTIDSCRAEFESLKNFYQCKKQDIKDIFDASIIGADDIIFNISAQKEFYGERLKIINNARHNMFFRIKSYDDIFKLARCF